jgi:hypothetical protein
MTEDVQRKVIQRMDNMRSKLVKNDKEGVGQSLPDCQINQGQLTFRISEAGMPYESDREVGRVIHLQDRLSKWAKRHITFMF